GVAHLRARDRDLRDALLAPLVADVAVLLHRLPARGGGGRRLRVLHGLPPQHPAAGPRVAGGAGRRRGVRASVSAKKRSASAAKGSGGGGWAGWPASGTTSTRASGSARAISPASARNFASSSPTTSATGARRSPSAVCSGGCAALPIARRLFARPCGRLRRRCSRACASAPWPRRAWLAKSGSAIQRVTKGS